MKLNLIKNKIFKNYLILCLAFLILEIIMRSLLTLPIFDWACLRIFLGINIMALILGTIISLFPDKVTNVLNIIIVGFISVYAFAQIGFNNFMGTFISVNSSSQLNKVWSYLIDYISGYEWTYYLLLIPLILVIVYYIFFNKKVKDKFSFKNKYLYLINIGAIVVLSVLFYFSMTLKFMQNKYQIESNIDLFVYPETPNIAVNQFGFVTYTMMDFKTIFQDVDKLKVESMISNENNNKNETISIIPDYEREIDDYSFEQVILNEDNKTYKNLHEYYINRNITDKNEMTGYFKDKNLIVILLESVNNVPFLYPEYFPTLNKLYNEGWTWENAYSPRNSCSTGNNEMTAITSLYTINNSCTANKYKKNVYPQSLFNIFNNAGYTTTSYHNYADVYYSRNTMHTAMGSSKYYNAYALDIKVNSAYEEWPSDVDLFSNSFDKYINEDKFMAFFSTVTTHRPYTTYSEYGDKHLDMFADLDISKSSKRYLSKMKELDLGLETLLTGLEAAGELDDTVIVLFGDHYPYGLSNSQLQEFYDYDITADYERDKTLFIIYNSEITPEKHSELTSLVNILPTIANLFDMEYDPRLYMGTDLFSDDYEPMVVFADGSWHNDKAFYNSSSGNIKFFDENNIMTDEEVIAINQRVSSDIKMSNLAIRNNYFDYLNKEKAKYPKNIKNVQANTIVEGE